MRQIVRYWPDAGEYWKEMRLRVGEGELDCLRWGRRLAPQDRGTQVEKGGDEFPAIVQRCPSDDFYLKLHEAFTEQPRLTPQEANELRQVTTPRWRRHRGAVTAPGANRPADLLYDKRFPRPHLGRVPRAVVDEALDEG